MQTATARRIKHYTHQNRRHAEYPVTIKAALSLLKLLRAPVMLAKSELKAKVIRADGTMEDYGVVSRRVVTTAGVNFIVSCHMNTAEMEAMNFHAMGTGSVAENITDTALGTEVETRGTGTQSTPAGNQYRTVATLTATAARSITEHGIFSVVTATSGTLLDRSVFAAIALAIGDSIQFTYTITYTAGG